MHLFTAKAKHPLCLSVLNTSYLKLYEPVKNHVLIRWSSYLILDGQFKY